MKKKKPLKIILIIFGVLIAYLLSLILLALSPAFLFAYYIVKDEKETKKEIFSYVLDNKQEITPKAPRAKAFYYDTSGFLDYGLDQGYYFSPDDTYWLVDTNTYSQTASCEKPLTKSERKQVRKDLRYRTEKICDNWYYFEGLADY